MKISNLTAKTSIEINEDDILVIEDQEGTKQTTVKDFKEYLLNNGITKSTKMLINQMMDNVINSLKASKYAISELFTYKMNVTIYDFESGDIYITLQSVETGKWLTAKDIGDLLVPGEDGICSKNFIINVLVDDVYVRSNNYTIHDANEESNLVPEGNVGYIKAHFDNLTQNEIASITYDDIMITVEDAEIEISFEIPIEDKHTYEFIGDPDMFNNNVSYIQNIG